MAVTTLKAIIDRFQVVLEGDSLNLKKATEEFSFDRQPNTVIDDVYRIEDAGLAESESLTNNVDARIDTLVVWIAKKAAFDSQAVRETVETTCNTIERKLIADGPSNNYHVTLDGREIQQPDGTDLIMASQTFMVDYDYSLS